MLTRLILKSVILRGLIILPLTGEETEVWISDFPRCLLSWWAQDRDGEKARETREESSGE